MIAVSVSPCSNAENPSDSLPKKRVTYEKVQDSLGRTSFKQVIVEDNDLKDYVEIDFGKKIYRDRKAFEKTLDVLSFEDRQYILDLPWPLTKVWHVKNERMEKILKKLQEE